MSEPVGLLETARFRWFVDPTVGSSSLMGLRFLASSRTNFVVGQQSNRSDRSDLVFKTLLLTTDSCVAYRVF